MATVIDNSDELKEVFKSALVEVLQERQDLVRELLDEVIEDIAFSRAIEEGEASPSVSREQIFEHLESAN
jgi:hypothetical protein